MNNEKLEGYEYYSNTLGSPKFILAPMVDQSELPWRMLSRKYGAELCYSPMYHASVFIRDKQYRNDALQTCSEDRPLIIQFCANDPEVFLNAAMLAQDHCDGIDLNLGCPQVIAKRGHYGAFLQDDWDLIYKMVKVCHEKLSVPISCKIRIFPSIEKTIQYAKMLESAGCQLLCVHGRTREQKGPETGLADWNYVKEIKKVLSIPVFSNGNIQYLRDVKKCLVETNVDGIMIAEGNLYNPLLFKGESPVCWEVSLEYIELAFKYELKNISYARGHIFKMCHHALSVHRDVRNSVAGAKNLSSLKEAVIELKEKCTELCVNNPNVTDDNLPFQHWLCQPYERPKPKSETKNSTKSDNTTVTSNDSILSRKKRKRFLKIQGNDGTNKEEKEILSILNIHAEKKMKSKPKYENCAECGNPRGSNCAYLLCKTCCKNRSKKLPGNCEQHKRKRRRDISTQIKS